MSTANGCHLLSLPDLLYVNSTPDAGRLCLHGREEAEYRMQPRQLPPLWGREATSMVTGSGGMVRQTPENFVVANQLQFVNRQLYYETRGLSIRYNDISIFNGGRNGPGIFRRFLDFTRSLPQPLYKHLRSITLMDCGATDWVSTLEAACKFCRLYPRAFVKYHQWKARPVGIPFVLHAVSVRHVFRRDANFVRMVTSDLALQQELLEKDRRALGIVPVLPPNLRMFPVNTTFDEKFFRSVVTEDKLEGWIADTIDGGVDAWIPLLRDYYQNGL